jgi:tetratricopeptide (TPR) repeat protein
MALPASRTELIALSHKIDHLYDLGRKEEGAALLQDALIHASENEAYRNFFGAEVAGYLERDRKKQKRLLLEAYRLGEDDPFIVKSVGVYFLMSDSERTAIKYFEKATELDPGDFESLRHKGLAYSNLGKEKKGMEWFAKAIALNPQDYDSMRQTGVSLSKLDKDLEAIKWFRKALAVNESDYDSMRQLGVSLAMLKKYDEAVKWLNLALAVNPNDFESKRNLRLVQKKITGEGETFLSRFITYLGRKVAVAWRWLLNKL